LSEKHEVLDAAALVHETLLGDGWQNATIGAAMTGDDSRYIAWNDEFCRLTGYSRGEMVDVSASLELADGHVEEESFRRAVRGERMFGTGDLRRKDGTIVRVNYWLVPTQVARSEFYLVLLWVPGDGPELGPRSGVTMDGAART
jgi:PAS domain S-box-containing protein